MPPTDTPLNAAALEGQTLSQRYLIDALIGQGGMAWVYKATDLQTQTSVAIKVLREHRRRNPKGEERFLREASTQAQMQHPNIVKVYNLFSEQGITGFVQEWCAGGDLHQFLQEHQGPLSPERLQSLFLPLLDAVAYAHEKGLIHRDIKPANVLLHPESCEQVKLNDFGLVKVLELDSLTSTGTVMGTVHYMAPEQFEETKTVDHRADIYSLGVLLYEMATGRLPFTGRMPSLGMKIMRNPPPLPQEAPTALHDLLYRCLAKRPEERFQDCHSVRGAFLSAMNGPSQIQEPASLTAALAHTASMVSYDDLQVPGFQKILSAPGSVDAQVEELAQPEAIEDTVALATSDPLRAAWSDTTPQEVPVFAMPETPTQPRRTSTSMGWLGILLLVGFGIGIFGALQWQSMQRANNRVDASNRVPSPTALRTRSDAVGQTPSGRPSQRPAARRVGARAVALLRTVPGGRALRVVNAREYGPSDAGGDALPDATRPLELPEQAAMASGRSSDAIAGQVPEIPGDGLLRTSGAELFRAALLAEARGALKAARKTLAIACQRQYIDACEHLGWFFFRGKGGPAVPAQGIAMFRKSCRADHKTACTNLGRLYLEARFGQPKDLTKARYWFSHGCQRQGEPGCLWLAAMMFKGMGGPRNVEKARQMLIPLCEKGSGLACRNLSYLYRFVLRKAPHRLTLASLYARKGCALNHITSCVAWGHALSTGQGTRRDPRQAFQAFQKACKGNNGTGCFFVANSLAKGIGVQKDTPAARRLALRSCQLKDEDGCHILGRMYTMGVGGKRDCTKANRAYRKACQLGEKTACREFCLDKHPTRRSSQ